MSQKLQELTEKLYREGVEKARSEAEQIIQEAENQRADTIKKAETEAEGIIQKAETEAASIISKGEAELKLAAKQALKALKQEAVNILAGNALAEDIPAALNDREFVAGLIKEIVSGWQAGYGIVSFGTRDLPWVVAYVRNQKKHHADGTTHDRLERTDRVDPPPDCPDASSDGNLSGDEKTR